MYTTLQNITHDITIYVSKSSQNLENLTFIILKRWNVSKDSNRKFRNVRKETRKNLFQTVRCTKIRENCWWLLETQPAIFNKRWQIDDRGGGLWPDWWVGGGERCSKKFLHPGELARNCFQVIKLAELLPLKVSPGSPRIVSRSRAARSFAKNRGQDQLKRSFASRSTLLLPPSALLTY